MLTCFNTMSYIFTSSLTVYIYIYSGKYVTSSMLYVLHVILVAFATVDLPWSAQNQSEPVYLPWQASLKSNLYLGQCTRHYPLTFSTDSKPIEIYWRKASQENKLTGKSHPDANIIENIESHRHQSMPKHRMSWYCGGRFPLYGLAAHHRKERHC